MSAVVSVDPTVIALNEVRKEIMDDNIDKPKYVCAIRAPYKATQFIVFDTKSIKQDGRPDAPLRTFRNPLAKDMVITKITIGADSNFLIPESVDIVVNGISLFAEPAHFGSGPNWTIEPNVILERNNSIEFYAWGPKTSSDISFVAQLALI